MENKKTKIVNFYGGPGSGKSSMASAVFSELKFMKVEVELVNEYAKKKVWEEAYKVFECQFYVCAKQAYDIFNVSKHVDLIITDSPIIMSLAYTNGDKLLDDLMIREHKKYEGIDIFLTRTKEYNSKGRYQTEEEAKEKDILIKKILKETQVSYIEFEGEKKSLPCIMDYINSKR